MEHVPRRWGDEPKKQSQVLDLIDLYRQLFGLKGAQGRQLF